MIVASIIFGILHSYSLFYMISTFLAVVILNYSYLIYRNKTLSSFAIVLSIPSIHNIIDVLLFIITNRNTLIFNL
ncbi:MAG TPA: hypothetical protein DCE09_03835 [Thermoanaerobacter sp.]|nr:hypothetical protein [Thermoanaerobacter sp.]